MKLAHCRTCHAPIVWTITAKGKKMPVDADPVAAPHGFRVNEDDENPVAVFVPKPEPGEKVYQSHFGTCPDAALYRRAV